MYSRSSHAFWENDHWFEGEWGYKWDVELTILGCPQAVCKIFNYGKCFGDMCEAENVPDAVGNVQSCLKQNLSVLNSSQNYFPYKNVEHKFTAYKNVDMSWVLSLRTAFDNIDMSEIGPLIIDSGCSTTCTPYLDDFIGEMETGHFGMVSTATKDVTHEITARGLIQLYVMDSLGRTAPGIVPANYSPECHVRLVSPQDYCQFHGMLKALNYYGGNATDFNFKITDGPVL